MRSRDQSKKCFKNSPFEVFKAQVLNVLPPSRAARDFKNLLRRTLGELIKVEKFLNYINIAFTCMDMSYL